MDVTRDNFEEAMEFFERTLAGPVEFVSFDLEMTGINFGGSEVNCWEDTPAERYEKMRRVASAFGIVQFGVTAWVRGDDGVRAVSVNVFVFPSESGDDVLLSPGAIAFLDKNGMDWATWLSKGVPFTDRLGEEDAVEEPIPLRSDEDASFAARELSRVREAFASSNTKTYLETESCPSKAAARHVHEAVRIEFRGALRTERRDGFKIGVAKISQSELAALREKARLEKQKRRGARRLFTAMSDACRRRRIPVVGHNCFYDLLFLFRHFEAPLPEDYVELKRKLNALFPLVYDTKVLATRALPPGVKTTLANLYDLLSNPPPFFKEHLECEDPVFFDARCPKYASDRFPVVAEPRQKRRRLLQEEEEEGLLVEEEAEDDDQNGKEDDGKKESYHEAGWDSFVTGLLYLRLFRNAPLVNRTYVIRSHAQVDLASGEATEPPAYAARGRLYVLRGAVAREAVAGLFASEVHKISFCGPEAYLVDADEPPAVALPNHLRLRSWADDAKQQHDARTTASPPGGVDDDVVVEDRRAPVEEETQPTSSRKRILSWFSGWISPRKKQRANDDVSSSPSS